MMWTTSQSASGLSSVSNWQLAIFCPNQKLYCFYQWLCPCMWKWKAMGEKCWLLNTNLTVRKSTKPVIVKGSQEVTGWTEPLRTSLNIQEFPCPGNQVTRSWVSARKCKEFRSGAIWQDCGVGKILDIWQESCQDAVVLCFLCLSSLWPTSCLQELAQQIASLRQKG